MRPIGLETYTASQCSLFGGAVRNTRLCLTNCRSQLYLSPISYSEAHMHMLGNRDAVGVIHQRPSKSLVSRACVPAIHNYTENEQSDHGRSANQQEIQ